MRKRNHRIKRMLAAAGVSVLCMTMQLPSMAYAADNTWPPNNGDSSSTIIGIEEYEKQGDYTGWLTIIIKVVDQNNNPVPNIYLTLTSPEVGDAGHGPNMNGSERYMTNENGELIFRIYPTPIRYTIKIPQQGTWREQEKDLGVITDKQDFTVHIVMLEEKKDNNNGNNGNNNGNNGNNSGNNGNNSGNNGNNNGNNGNNSGNNGNNSGNYGNNNGNYGNNNGNNGNKVNNNGNSGNNNSSKNDKDKDTNKDKTTKEEYVLPGPDNKNNTKDDVTVKPDKGSKGENNSSIDKDGNVELPDGGTVIRPSIPDKGDISIKVPEGTVVKPDGTIVLPDNNQQTVITIPGKDKVLGTEDDIKLVPGLDDKGNNNTTIDRDGTVKLPDGGEMIIPSNPDKGDVKVILPEGATVGPDGTIKLPDGTKKGIILPGPDGRLDSKDDVTVEPDLSKKGKDRSVIREDGSVYLPDGGTVTGEDGKAIDVPAGTIVLPDGTIVYPSDAGITEIGFWDCSFHWMEIAVIFLSLLMVIRRITEIERHNKELDKIENQILDEKIDENEFDEMD